MLPWLAIEGAPPALSPTAGAAILYSAIGSLLLAYAGWSYAVSRLGAVRAGATMHLMPAMGVALAALFLGEYPQLYHFVGIGLILGGVGLSSVK
jgi:drug/metabolite transporter (DMT)-like permease